MSNVGSWAAFALTPDSLPSFTLASTTSNRAYKSRLVVSVTEWVSFMVACTLMSVKLECLR